MDYKCCPEHPAIQRTLDTGYPDEEWIKSCPWCDEDMTDDEYLIGGDWVCRECAEMYLTDYISTNFEDAISAALGVAVRRMI